MARMESRTSGERQQNALQGGSLHSEDSGCSGDFLQTAWRSGALSALPMLFLTITGYTIAAPYLPDLMTNFFAGRDSGAPIHCESFVGSGDNHLPQACIQGSAESVMWSSYSSFVSHAVLAFLLYPLSGVWSDMVGRKPFLLLGQTLSVLPLLAILFNITAGLSLYLYYPIQVLSEVISTISTTLAMISDCLPPEHRAAGFALTLGSLSLALAFAPVAGQMLGLQGAVVVGVALKVLGILYTLVVMKETVSPEARALAREKSAQFWEQPAEQDADCQLSLWSRLMRAASKQPSIRAMVQGLAIVLRNSEFMRLTAAQMGAALVVSGLMQVENQYLLILFGFHQHDFAIIMLIAGLGMFLAQVVFLPLLLCVVKERALIVFGFGGILLKLVGLAIAQTKTQVLVSITFGTLYFMAYPSISSIKANSVPTHELGAVQGALSGATALASGFGPLIMNQIFSWATTAVYMPRVLPAACAVLSLGPLALVCWLDLDKLQRWKLEQERLQQASSSLGEPLLVEAEEAAKHIVGKCSAASASLLDDSNYLDGCTVNSQSRS